MNQAAADAPKPVGLPQQTVTYAPAPVYAQPVADPNTRANNLNIGFAIAIILYEIMALPIYGVLFGLNDVLRSADGLNGLYLIVVATILLIVGKPHLTQGSDSSTPISSGPPSRA